MAIKQLSVFVENKEGSLAAAVELLSEAGVDLRAMSIADTSDYGILRLIVDGLDKAKIALADNGILYTVTDVCAFSVADKPGGLASVLRALSDNGVNIEYLYSLITSKNGNAYAVMRVDDNENAEKVLAGAGITVVSEEDLA